MSWTSCRRVSDWEDPRISASMAYAHLFTHDLHQMVDGVTETPTHPRAVGLEPSLYLLLFVLDRLSWLDFQGWLSCCAVVDLRRVLLTHE